LSLAVSGVLLPFFSDPASGDVSVFEVVSPVVPTTTAFGPGVSFVNSFHAVFFRENCARDGSAGDVETAKQAKAYISAASPFLLNFNGLAAIDVNFPVHTRTHWINTKSGRLRELEPIILDTFLTLAPEFLPLVGNPGAGAAIGLCGPGTGPFTGSVNNGFCWSPLRSAASFVTPQETASIVASVYLICPTADIQSPTGGGEFGSNSGFPRIQNRDGSFGFPSRNIVTGASVTSLRGRIYDDNEFLARDTAVGCACLSTVRVLAIDGIYGTPPTNLGGSTVPVWYTEFETTAVTSNTVLPNTQHFSFTGYWGLEVTGHEATLFHRMSPASLEDFSSGTANPFADR
jgi:hypothetical protein